jgi:hypothetical protein
MMQMADMPMGMIWGMGLLWLLIVISLVPARTPWYQTRTRVMVWSCGRRRYLKYPLCLRPWF